MRVETLSEPERRQRNAHKAHGEGETYIWSILSQLLTLLSETNSADSSHNRSEICKTIEVIVCAVASVRLARQTNSESRCEGTSSGVV
jgi:hypothetical protein